MKKFLCLLLLLCMLMPMTLSCRNEGDANDSDSASATSDVVDTGEKESETKNKYDVYDDIGDVDFDGRTITIANCGRSVYLGEIEAERYTGDSVNDSIYKRNRTLEKRLNITIENAVFGNDQFDIPNEIGKHLQSGVHAWDIAMNPIYSIIITSQKGYLHDLSKSDTLDLSKPYWNQMFNHYASVGNGHQFIATGAVSLRFYRSTYVTLVNDKVLDSVEGAPNLFDVVDDGKWTLEYQGILASSYYTDLGVAGKDQGDSFGFITTAYNGVDGYFASCEMSLMEKSDDGYFTLSLDVQRMHDVMEEIIDLFTAKYTWCEPHNPAHETGNGEWPAIAKMFAEGNSLMATIRFEQIEGADIQNMKDEYSILPIPKFNEDQDTYYSFQQASFTGMVIPATSPEHDVDTFGTVMEAMASESYRTVVPAYYEKTLKGKYANNAASKDMLDMIFTYTKTDAGHLYNNLVGSPVGGFVQAFRTISRDAVEKGTENTVASKYNAQVLAKVQEEINTLEKQLRKVVGE